MRSSEVLRQLTPLLLVFAIGGCSSPPEVLVPPAKETSRGGAPAPPPPAASIAVSEPTGEITLDLRDTDLTEALKSISRQAEVNVIADPEVKEKVTVQLERVDLRSALEVIARQARCKIVIESDRLIRLTQPPSITMEFQDADIKTVIQLLAKQAGANIVIGSDVQGKVTLSLREVPWMDALQAVAKTGGYVVVREGDSSNWRLMRP
jgi:type II secretory pathway component HofQ